MTRFLKRYQETRDLHFVTFSCYCRAPRLTTDRARTTFLRSLEAARIRFNFYVCGYVLMPEHVHLIISERHAGVRIADSKATSSAYAQKRS